MYQACSLSELKTLGFLGYHHNLPKNFSLKKIHHDLYESIKSFEIKTFMVLSWSFANNTFSFCLLLSELAITIKIPTNIAKAKIETQAVVTETKTNKFSI